MSSTVIAKNVQIGADGTASNNFTIFQPATPDGTLRIGNGNTGITSSAVALTSAGNVGIGTSSPSAKLDVSTSINLSAQNYLNVAYDLGGGAGWLSGYNITYSSSSIRNVATGTLSGVVYGGSGLQFYTNTSAAAGTAASERMRIDSSGNVGIGASSPAFVYSDDTTLTVNGKQSATSYRSALELGNNGSLGAFYFCSTANAVLGSYANIPLAFRTNNTERARIDSSGRLLVGKTTNGDYVTGIEMQPAGAVLSYRTSGVAGIFGRTDNGETVRFTNNGNGVGNISTTGSATAYNTSSDYRLKHDIAPMTGALAKVQALNPVTYKWNADNSESQGFIAHELQAVVPDCVTGEKDAVDADGNPVYQGIDTSFLVATLTSAIQELKAINDAQAKTITALTARVTALETN